MSDHLEQLIVDVKESLEREIHQGVDRLGAKIDQLNTRFDTQAARLEHLTKLERKSGQ